MKFSLKKSVLYTNAALLFLSAVIIFIHKTPSFYKLHFIQSTAPYHIIFLISFSVLFCFLLTKKISIDKIFLLTIPTELALIFGTYKSNHLHYLFHLFVGLWIISLGTYLIFKRHKKINRDSIKKPRQKKNDFLFAALFLIAITCITHFSFGFNNLKNEAYTDEKLWTYGSANRIEKFWKNILKQDWIHTRPSDKPGVTLAIISGTGLIWERPSEFFHNFSNTDALLQMLYTLRLPVLLFGTLMIPVFYLVLRKVYYPQIALIGTIFIGTSPILLGISRIINPDALIYIFMPLSLFSYFAYTKKNDQKWLYATGFFLGLSLLTKYIANLLFVFFFVSIFTQLIFNNDKANKKEVFVFMKEKMIEYLIIIFISMSTFYLLFPGVWLKADRLLIATVWSQAFLPVWKYFAAALFLVIFDLAFLKSQLVFWVFEKVKKLKKPLLLSVPLIFLASVIFVIANTYTNMSVFDFEKVLSSPKSFAKVLNLDAIAIFFSGFYALIFAVSPLALLGAITGILFSAKDVIKNKITFTTLTIWYCTFFIIIYYLASTFSLVGPTVRYQIILYPLLYVISGVGIWTIFEIMLSKSKQHALTTYIPIALVLIFQFSTLWNVSPFFFSYNSSLLPQKYIVNPKDMGDGNYKTAQFLNDLPNAKNLFIWSDNNGVCALFDGECSNTNKTADFSKRPQFDYYVISKGREARVTNPIKSSLSQNPNYFLRLDRLYETQDFIFELKPGNRDSNFIRIIPKDKVEVYAH